MDDNRDRRRHAGAGYCLGAEEQSAVSRRHTSPDRKNGLALVSGPPQRAGRGQVGDCRDVWDPALVWPPLC